MKMNINFILIILMLLFPLIGFSQGNGGGGDPDVPIDGGLSVLLAGGIAYGMKQVARRKNDSTGSSD